MKTAFTKSVIEKKEPAVRARVDERKRIKGETENSKIRKLVKDGKETEAWKRVVGDLIVGRHLIRDFPCFVLLNLVVLFVNGYLVSTLDFIALGHISCDIFYSPSLFRKKKKERRKKGLNLDASTIRLCV